MQLSARATTILAFLLVLWILWCILVINWLTPYILLRITFWDWLTSWALCLMPVVAVAAVLVHREMKAR